MSKFTEEGLEEALKAIGKRYPEALGTDYDRNPPRISTGSYELDRATGGGMPMGRFSRIWGGYSSGKSLTCWNVIKNAQQMGLGPCVYYNIEKQFHPDFVSSLGVDLNDLIVVEGSIVEDVGTQMETLLGQARVHVLDSLGSAISIDELNTALDAHPAMALKARAWGRALSKALARLDQENAVIMIDQARDTFSYGGGEHPPNGRFVEFTSSLTIHFRRGKWLFKDKDGFLDDEGKNTATLSGQTEPHGVTIQAKVGKTRVCKPQRTATMYLDYDKMNFDPLAELTKAATFYNVLEQTSVGRYLTPEGVKLHGQKAVREYVSTNENFRNQVIAKMKEDY